MIPNDNETYSPQRSKVCEFCQETFIIYRTQGRPPKYCSNKCLQHSYKARNPDKVKEQQKRCNIKRNYSKVWKDENREHVLKYLSDYSKMYYNENKEKINERRKKVRDDSKRI